MIYECRSDVEHITIIYSSYHFCTYVSNLFLFTVHMLSCMALLQAAEIIMVIRSYQATLQSIREHAPSRSWKSKKMKWCVQECPDSDSSSVELTNSPLRSFPNCKQPMDFSGTGSVDYHFSDKAVKSGSFPENLNTTRIVDVQARSALHRHTCNEAEPQRGHGGVGAPAV